MGTFSSRGLSRGLFHSLYNSFIDCGFLPNVDFSLSVFNLLLLRICFCSLSEIQKTILKWTRYWVLLDYVMMMIVPVLWTWNWLHPWVGNAGNVWGCYHRHGTHYATLLQPAWGHYNTFKVILKEKCVCQN